MEYTADTPRRQLTIGNQTFSIPAPFAAGMVMDEGQAHSLNQTLAENTRNNLVGRVNSTRKAIESGKTSVSEFVITQDEIDAYVAEYEFGARGGSQSRLSPLEREQRKIALEKVKAAVAMAGHKFSSLSDEKVEELVTQAIERVPEITKEAERRLKNADKIALDGLDLGLGDGSEGAAEEQAAA